MRWYQLSRQDLSGVKERQTTFFIIKTIVDKYLSEKEAEYTGALWTSRKPSIKLIEKSYGLR
jgi:hypothetical protein